jgi:DNA-binding XRE family transcriptional regulator
MRETIRCPNPSCHLTQFDTANHKCRKCKHPLHPENDQPKPHGLQPVPVVVRMTSDGFSMLSLPSFWISFTLWYLREQQGLSQRDVARSLGVPRTYVSKVETYGVCPLIKYLPRWAEALGVTQERIVSVCECLMNGKQ